ncbi:hypothetical protein D3C81_1305640 [compost metagenome]
MGTGDATCIGGELAGIGKTLDVAGLEHDHRGQHFADTRHRSQQRKLRTQPAALQQVSLQTVNLRIERFDDRHVGLDRQSDVGWQAQPVNQRR